MTREEYEIFKKVFGELSNRRDVWCDLLYDSSCVARPCPFFHCLNCQIFKKRSIEQECFLRTTNEVAEEIFSMEELNT